MTNDQALMTKEIPMTKVLSFWCDDLFGRVGWSLSTALWKLGFGSLVGHWSLRHWSFAPEETFRRKWQMRGNLICLLYAI